MKCTDCQVLLPEFALDVLEPGESAQVAEHLAAGCADCRQCLDDVRAAWASMADMLPPIAPPPELKAVVLARARADTAPRPARPRAIECAEFSERASVAAPRAGRTGAPARRWRFALPYVAALLAGIALGCWFAQGTPSDRRLIARYHDQLQQAERTFGAPRMRYASLHTSDDRQRVQGTLIWDDVAAELHVYAFDLDPPPDGSIYRLWFVADDASWIHAGDLAVGPGGVCSAVISVPAPARLTSRVAVTTESKTGTGRGEQQHGPIGFRGEFSE